MKYVKIVLIIFVIASIGYLVAKEYAGLFNNHSGDSVQTAAQAANHIDGIVMYYFHGNSRCPTCMAIERYSHEAAMPYLNDKILIWQTVNVEDIGNKHFIYDFSLSSSGPVIVKYEKGEIERYQILDRVWQLARDKEKFTKYVDDEVKRFVQ